MPKVVFNACYGGFGLSPLAINRLVELRGTAWVKGEEYRLSRHDPHLVQVVEELGPLANGECSRLEIAIITSCYRIEEYDGSERVVEPNDLEWIYP